MRRLKKLSVPSVLASNAATWLKEYIADRSSDTKKLRYRHKDIKKTLREETGWKCVYCESKIGHNTPGDIEHKVPSSKEEALHFEWANLTVACTECNRRKNDYYERGCQFLDPYSDDVEAQLVHLGPLVYWAPGHARAEATVRILDLDSGKRPALIERKQETLEKARALLEGVAAAADTLMGELRRDEAMKMCETKSEYSATINAYFKKVGAI